MPEIKGISSSLLLCYVKMQANISQDSNEVAESLAKDENISKEKLDSFLQTIASSDMDEAAKEQLMALIAMEKDWDEISDENDSISVEDFKKYMDQYIQNNYASTNEDSSSVYTSTLNSLLSGTTDENDDKNAELVATLTNLIANSSSNTTIETEA